MLDQTATEGGVTSELPAKSVLTPGRPRYLKPQVGDHAHSVILLLVKSPIHLAWVLSWAALVSFAPVPTSASGGTVPGDPLIGSGNVNRSVLTYREMFTNTAPSAPVDDSAGFAVPADAAAPSQKLEGTLTLHKPTLSGSFQVLRDDEKIDTGVDSPWRHLASFSFQFVQNGSYLIPVQQGLIITGNSAWNYIVGPGRVWQGRGDHGYTRTC